MSTLTMFLTWLLSLVGLQPCDNGVVGIGDCDTATPQAIQVTTTPGSSQKDTLSFISNGL